MNFTRRVNKDDLPCDVPVKNNVSPETLQDVPTRKRVGSAENGSRNSAIATSGRLLKSSSCRQPQSSSSAKSLNPQEVDLPLNVDLCLPDESLMSEVSSKQGNLARNQSRFFPWMVDAEIV